MAKTSIAWTDFSWNPIRARRVDDGKVGWHCEKVSAGCANCYAETFNGRRLPNGGTGLGYDKSSRGKVETVVDDDVLALPMRWKKPRKIFVCSMTDLFGEWVTDEQVDRVFATMARASQHTFQVLTKRAARMRSYMTGRDVWDRIAKLVKFGIWRGASPNPFWPLGNVWLGASVEDQKTADGRIPLLLGTPAAVRFVSYEPALGLVDFERYLQFPPFHDNYKMSIGYDEFLGIDWIIVGGESGPGARPFDVTWARSTIAQCRAAGVACFVKQLGSNVLDRNDAGFDGGDDEWPSDTVVEDPIEKFPHQGALVRVRLKSGKGGDMAEWPPPLRVRQLPSTA